MKLLCGCIFVLVFILSGVACGDEVYRYTDSKGNMHFVDDLNKVPKKYRKQVDSSEPRGHVYVMGSTPASRSSNGRKAQEPRQQSASTVEVYMTSWCGYCKKMIQFLNEKGIPYTAYDIEKDSAAESIYRSLGGSGVPVVRIGSHVVHGYSPEEVMTYYNDGR